MIAPRDELPLVQFEGGEVILFDRAWLDPPAGARGGEGRLPAVVAGRARGDKRGKLFSFPLRGNVLPVPRLAKAVHSALQVIGYAEVARHFETGPPPARVSLLEMAKKAGTGYELAFFQLLARGMQGLLESKAAYLEFFDLEEGVKQLKARKVWARDCQALREEIVSFLRDRFAGATHPVTFSVL